MTSNDVHYVTAEMFDSGIRELKAEIRAVNDNVRINTVRIEELHYFIGIGFAIMAVVVALVGFVITLAPMFREMYKDKRQERKERAEYVTRSEVEEAISRALSGK